MDGGYSWLRYYKGINGHIMGLCGEIASVLLLSSYEMLKVRDIMHLDV